MRRFSLTQKAFLAVSVILLPIALSFLFIYLQSRDYSNKKIFNELNAVKEGYEGQVYLFIEMMKRRTVDFASDGFIRQELEKAIGGSESAAVSLSEHLIRNKLSLYSTLTAIHVISPQGVIVSSTEAGRSGTDASGEEFFLKGKNGIAATEINSLYPGPVLINSAPILTQDKKRRIGVIANVIHLSELNRIMTGEFKKDLGVAPPEGLPQGMDIYLVNDQKRIIAGTPLGSGKGTADISPVRACLESGAGMQGFYLDYDGAEVAGSSACIKSMRWTLVAESYKETVLAPSRAILRRAVATGFVVAGLVLLLFTIFFRLVLRPINAVAQAAKRIADGDYNVNLPVQTNDEIGILSGGINRMATDIKQTTTLLKEHRDRLQAILDNSSAFVYLKDLDGKYILANRWFKSALGIDPDEMKGKTDRDLYSTDIAGMYRANDIAVIEANEPVRFEESAVFEGEQRTYISVKYPLLDASGRPYAIGGISTDITERKRMEEELRLLFMITQAIIESKDFQSAIGTALSSVSWAAGWEFAEAWIPCSSGQEIDCTQVVCPGDRVKDQELGKRASLKPGEGLAGKVWATRQAQWLSVARRTGEQASGAIEAGFGTGFALPIVSSGSVLAVLAFYMSESREKDERLMGLITNIAAQLGLFIQHKLDIDEIKKGSERLEKAQQIAKMGSWEWDMPGNRIIWSDEMYRIFGIAKGEFGAAFESFMEYVEPCDRDRIKKALDDAIGRKAPYSIDFTVKRPDGEKRVLSCEGEVSFDDAGNPVGMSGTAQDVTARKKMEEANERLTAIINATTDIVALADTAGRVVYVNDAGRALLGIGPDEDITALRIPDAHPEWAAKKVLEEGIPAAMRYGFWSGETAFLDSRGKVIPASQVILAHKDVYGDVKLLSTIARDISERVRAEELLRESEEKYRSVFEKSKDLIFITTPEGEIIDINPAGVELFGYSSRQEFLDRKASEFYDDPQDRERFKAEILRKGFVRDFEVNLRKKDGHRVIGLITASAMFDEKGRVSAYMGMVRDITAQTELEQQLLQSQKMEAIGQLTGGIAHDFNNLLTAIIGYVDIMIMQTNEGDPLRGYSEEVLNLSRSATELIQGLLAFSRKNTTEPVPAKLDWILSDIEKLLSRLISEEITFNVIYPGDDLSIMAHSGQIEQAITNLITNARDAMPNGGVLTVKAELVELGGKYSRITEIPGEYALITVSDTGVGIRKEILGKIFEPFFTTKEHGKGTGLGLSTVYWIIKQHKGYIDVYSEPGIGTTFKIYLPAVKAVTGADDQVQKQPLPEGGSEKILLAEDDPDVRRFNKTLLEEFGYTVIEACDGNEAVEKMIENADEIKLMVLDVIMPGKNAKEVYDEITRVKPGKKAIFVSGYTEEIIGKTGLLKKGMDINFVSKPITPSELLRKIRALLDEDGEARV